MYMYVCIYVCMFCYLHKNICIFKSMYVYMNLYFRYACMNVRIHVCLCERMYVCNFECMYILVCM